MRWNLHTFSSTKTKEVEIVLAGNVSTEKFQETKTIESVCFKIPHEQQLFLEKKTIFKIVHLQINQQKFNKDGYT